MFTNFRHTILGSREHTCINPMVRSAKPAEIMPKCKEFVNKGKCEFKINLANYNENVPMLRKKINNSIGCDFNLEELASMTESIKCCPYYTANHLLSRDAEIIFCPFTYILGKINNKFKIKLNFRSFDSHFDTNQHHKFVDNT